MASITILFFSYPPEIRGNENGAQREADSLHLDLSFFSPLISIILFFHSPLLGHVERRETGGGDSGGDSVYAKNS